MLRMRTEPFMTVQVGVSSVSQGTEPVLWKNQRQVTRLFDLKMNQ